MSLPENTIISKTLLTIDKYKSLSNLKQAVIDNDYVPSSSKFLRSLLWKSVYITESLNIQSWQAKLNDSRRVYHGLIKDEDMTIPWYKLEADSAFYNPVELSRNSSLRRKKKLNIKTRLARVTVGDNDPLGGAGDGGGDGGGGDGGGGGGTGAPDGDLDLLNTIILDIDRLFPGEKYIDNKFYKHQLIEVLYVWAKCHPTIGYKQGFHEILGLMYINMRQDSVSIPNTNTFSGDDLKILSLFDVNYLCHDLFTMFNKFMVNSGIIGSFYEDEKVLMNSIETFNMYLMKVDQLIHYTMISKLKLESQLWCIRYFRLLLSRELGNDLSLTNGLWDKLITVDGNKIPVVLYFLVIVMLINIKSDLIASDFSESLSLLLHYPITDGDSKFTHTIFTDGLKLFNNRDNDLKLYELGIKINEKLNPDLRISLSYNGRSSGESMRSRTGSPVRKSTETDTRAEKMAFEKYRMEMRLKKKAQLLMRS